MTCPQCQGAEKLFDKGVAEKDLHDYRKHGPGKTARLLIEALKSAGIQGMTLLDIGGGVGVIQHELLKSGASAATHVDASSAYLEAAKEEAQRLGHADRVSYRYGNFVDLAADIPAADIVTLEKVICCYPDMRALVGLSSAHAGKFYAVVFPRDTWSMKIGGRVMNIFLRFQTSGFRFFVHPTEAIEAVIRKNGLERSFYRNTLFWQVIVYARVPATGNSV
jgi:2-polyprenyl-3-methyl-5-hydroxy-6-metoxy-1,4-benzoquinol methylase